MQCRRASLVRSIAEFLSSKLLKAVVSAGYSQQNITMIPAAKLKIIESVWFILLSPFEVDFLDVDIFLCKDLLLDNLIS